VAVCLWIVAKVVKTPFASFPKITWHCIALIFGRITPSLHDASKPVSPHTFSGSVLISATIEQTEATTWSENVKMGTMEITPDVCELDDHRRLAMKVQFVTCTTKV
jgi:hypothetical protein